MKKIIMGLAFVIAIGGALFTNNSSYAGESSLASITLYKPTACTPVICNDTDTEFACTDLKVNSDCSGSLYSGGYKRNIK